MTDHKKYSEGTHLLQIAITAALMGVAWACVYWIVISTGGGRVPATILASISAMGALVGYSLMVTAGGK